MRKFVAIAALMVCSCANRVVIPLRDLAYQQALRSLEATAREVAELTPLESERQMFMQAESFYRYRFEPPKRSVGMHLAQAAAVVAELPALQSFSGSLDVNDLQIKAYDGAVQLWESLLVRFPNTALRPLALYRLGWAYRSSGVAGLPRRNGDEAFRCLLTAPSTRLSRNLLEDALATPWKSKHTAAAWSVIPGAAHFYVGEYVSGSARLVVALASAAAVLWPTVKAIQLGGALSFHRNWPLLVSGFVGFTILSIDYTSSYEDVLRSIVTFNETQERAFAASHPDAP